MRFIAKFKLNQQSTIVGRSSPSLKGNYEDSCCHEFYVCDVENISVNEAKIVLVAGLYASGNLYGPACLREERSMVYPCNVYRCQVGCPCHLCWMKKMRCLKAEASNQTCGISCNECSHDREDHSLFHRAIHMSCNFCSNLEVDIANVKFKVPRYSLYRRNSEVVDAALFQHMYGHNEVEEDEESSKFACDKCDMEFLYRSDLKKHEIARHYGAEHKCLLCGEIFSRKDNLTVHTRAEHKEGVAMFECEICRDLFSKKSNLDRHSRVKRQCEVCNEVFCSLKQVQQHKRIMHPKTPIKCDQCFKTFSSQWNYKVHMENKEDKLCDVCGKFLCNGFDLTGHIASVHNMRVCPICDNGDEWGIVNFKHHMYIV